MQGFLTSFLAYYRGIQESISVILARAARWLTEPAVQNPLEERQAQLLSLLILLTMLLDSAFWLGRIIFPRYKIALSVEAATSLGLVLVYALSRTKYYRASAVLVTVFATGIAVANTTTYPENSYIILFALSSLAAAAFLQKRYALLLLLLNGVIFGIVLLTLQERMQRYEVQDFLFYVVFSLLAFVFVSMREQDIRQIDQQARQLENNMRFYSSIIQSMSDGVVARTINGEMMTSNASAERILGMTPDQFLKGESGRAIHEDGTDFASEDFPAMVTLRTGVPQEEVVMGVHKPNGELCWISVSTQPLLLAGEAHPSGVVITFSDITAQRQMIQALKEREQRYRSLFEQVNDAVFILNLDGVHMDVNRKACEMLGYPYEELVNITAREVVAPAEYPKSQNILQQLLAGETIPIYERIFRHKNGTEFPVEINVQLVRDEAGEPIYLQSIVRDISRRKAGQQKILEFELLKERNRVFGEFIQAISHDLRTPLAVISNNTSLIRKTSTPEKYLQLIDAQVERLTKIVDALLTMSRLSQGSELEMESIEINLLVKSVVDKVLPLARQRSLSIQSSPTDAAPLVRGDRVELERMLWNLVHNAVFYTPEGGEPVLVSTAVEGDRVVISVHDRGVGIAEEDLPQLFRPFFRTDRARNLQTGGVGLGLAIAHKIAEVHGGGIRIESTPGEGSTFKVDLPIQKTTGYEETP